MTTHHIGELLFNPGCVTSFMVVCTYDSWPTTHAFRLQNKRVKCPSTSGKTGLSCQEIARKSQEKIREFYPADSPDSIVVSSINSVDLMYNSYVIKQCALLHELVVEYNVQM